MIIRTIIMCIFAAGCIQPLDARDSLNRVKPVYIAQFKLLTEPYKMTKAICEGTRLEASDKALIRGTVGGLAGGLIGGHIWFDQGQNSY